MMFDHHAACHNIFGIMPIGDLTKSVRDPALHPAAILLMRYRVTIFR